MGVNQITEQMIDGIVKRYGETTDNRSRIQRLLNYKRYIDFLIERELENDDRKHGERGSRNAIQDKKAQA